MSPWDGVAKLVRHGIVEASRVARAALVVDGLARIGRESQGRRGRGPAGNHEGAARGSAGGGLGGREGGRESRGRRGRRDSARIAKASRVARARSCEW